jgi:Protein of unknown function (DUF4242)
LPVVSSQLSVQEVAEMPKYLVERTLPAAGTLSKEKLQEIARKSNDVLASMGPSIQWVQSYIAGDALFCIYIATNEDAIREHGRRGGFPVTRVVELAGGMDPTTAEGSRRVAGSKDPAPQMS